MPPRLARLLAIVAAIALVGGAFVLRSALSGDDEGVASGPGASTGGDGPDGPIRVICDEDLGDDACDAIGDLDGVDELEVMTASEALADDALGAEDPAYDAWVTLDPWPQILDVARDEARLPAVAEGEGAPLASSALAILANPDRGVDCGEAATWDCLTEVAATQSIGLPTLSSAAGPLVLGAAAVGLLGEGFSISDARTPEADAELSQLLDSGAPASLATEATNIVVQQGRYQGLVTIDGLATTSAATTRGQQQGLTPGALAPEATIGVVLAPIGPNGPAAVERLSAAATDQTVTEALAEAGWSGPPVPSSGLPDPDLIFALNEEFRR